VAVVAVVAVVTVVAVVVVVVVVLEIVGEKLDSAFEPILQKLVCFV